MGAVVEHEHLGIIVRQLCDLVTAKRLRYITDREYAHEMEDMRFLVECYTEHLGIPGGDEIFAQIQGHSLCVNSRGTKVTLDRIAKKRLSQEIHSYFQQVDRANKAMYN